MKNKHIPTLRFKDFKDEWILEKLGNFAPLRGGYAFKSEKFVEIGIPIVRISNILSDGTVSGQFAYYTEQNKDNNYQLVGESILLAMSGATTGKISLLNSEQKYYQNQRVGYFEKNNNISYSYLFYLLSTKQFTNQLNSVLVAGAQPNISSKEVESFEFVKSNNYAEQSAIGTLFQTLDELLSAYKDNLANYQAFKATMLSKMFPKAGQTTPEIRLDGFDGEWEVNTLNNLATFSKGNGYTKGDLSDNGWPIILYG